MPLGPASGERCRTGDASLEASGTALAAPGFEAGTMRPPTSDLKFAARWAPAPRSPS
jgi:hypothetical protein